MVLNDTVHHVLTIGMQARCTEQLMSSWAPRHLSAPTKAKAAARASGGWPHLIKVKLFGHTECVGERLEDDDEDEFLQATNSTMIGYILHNNDEEEHFLA